MQVLALGRSWSQNYKFESHLHIEGMYSFGTRGDHLKILYKRRKEGLRLSSEGHLRRG